MQYIFRQFPALGFGGFSVYFLVLFCFCFFQVMAFLFKLLEGLKRKSVCHDQVLAPQRKNEEHERSPKVVDRN